MSMKSRSKIARLGSAALHAAKFAWKHRRTITGAYKRATNKRSSKRPFKRRRTGSSSSSNVGGYIGPGSSRPGCTSVYGRRRKRPSKSFRNRVLQATNLPKTLTQQSAYNQTCAIGLGNYFFLTHGSYPDLIELFKVAALAYPPETSADSTVVNLLKSTHTVTIANMCNAVAYCTLSEVVPRVDIDITDSQTIVNLFIRGLANVVNPRTADQSMTDISVKLFDSPLFCQHFKIRRVKKLEIAPGQNYKHTMVYNRPVTINAGRDLNVHFQYFSRMTKFLAVQFYGGLVSGHLTGDTTLHPTTSGIKLAFLETNSYSFVCPHDPNKYTTFQNRLLPGLIEGTEINEDTGLPERIIDDSKAPVPVPPADADFPSGTVFTDNDADVIGM